MSILDNYKKILQDYKTKVIDEVKERVLGRKDEEIQKNEEETTEQPFRISILKKGNAIQMGDFIKLMENLENKYPEDERGYKNMVTQFRKNFSEYNTNSWNTYLIPDAPKELKFKLSEIEANQTIELPSGYLIDIGHVFAGLDAFYHNTSVKLWGLTVLRNNIEATTWVGDFGSMLGELAQQYTLKSKDVNNEILQKLINQFASPADLLGDIDAYVLPKFIKDVNFSENVKLSQIFKLFYFQGYSYEQNRFLIFLDQLGCNWIFDYNFDFSAQKGDNLYNSISQLDNQAQNKFYSLAKEIAYSAGAFVGLKYNEYNDKGTSFFSISRLTEKIAYSTMFTFLLELKKGQNG